MHRKQEARTRRSNLIWIAGIIIFLQILLPLRQFFFAGSSRFTREGSAFSWRRPVDAEKMIIRVFDRKGTEAEKVHRNFGPDSWLGIQCDPLAIHKTVKTLCERQHISFLRLEASCEYASTGRRALILDPAVNICDTGYSSLRHNPHIYADLNSGLSAWKEYWSKNPPDSGKVKK